MRSINSPGVQITETDLSVVQQPVVGTQIFATGFAAEGPTDQVLNITSIVEFENTFGKPQTPSERYFYHTCKEILNSPGNLYVSRLPYGSGAGANFADKQYSGLFYPVTQNGSILDISEPTYFSLSEEEFLTLKEGNFTWNSTFCTTNTATSLMLTTSTVSIPTDPLSAAAILNIVGLDNDGVINMSFSTPGFVDVTFEIPTTSVVNIGQSSCFAYNPATGNSSVRAGIIVLNSSQTIIDQNFEGYYTVLTDNADIGPDTDFTSVLKFNSLTATNQFYSVPESRLNVALSASSTTPRDSVSEAIERTQTYYFSDNYYNDSLLLNVFKVYKSNNEPQTLSIQLVETYAGSLDKTKKELSTSGSGAARSYFLENTVNDRSPNITVLVNPAISTDLKWNNLNSTNTQPAYTARTTNSCKALFPVGVYKPSYSASLDKKLGDIPTKLERALRLVESAETVNLDVVVDGGLSTIHTNADVVSEIYNDTDMQPLGVININIDTHWRTIFNIFNTFVSNTRKDCVFISDPLRQIFVNGFNTKTLSRKTHNFNTNIYSPLKHTYTSINSNYSVAYGNWVRVQDTASDSLVWIPFSGYAAAIYARTDAVAYPWIAPAGLNRGIVNNINDIAFNPNQKQRDFLYTIGINPVCFFTGDGYAVFGQKTLQNKPSAFDRVNVRRLFLALEKAVVRVAKYFVFEPNTATTRSRLVNTITPVFDLAKNTEGLYDYLIVCDERNNTATTIDNNELIVDIYIKPVRTAEFILINFIATRTSQNFQELI